MKFERYDDKDFYEGFPIFGIYRRKFSVRNDLRETEKEWLKANKLGDLLTKKKKLYDIECEVLKRKYPIQYRVREAYWWAKYYVTDIIPNFCKGHRQWWLIKTIPYNWCDKVELMPNILLTMVKHYVEDEKGLEDICHSEETVAAINWLYRWGKIRSRLTDKKRDLMCGWIIEESLIYKLDAKAIKLLSEHYTHLWT